MHFLVVVFPKRTHSAVSVTDALLVFYFSVNHNASEQGCKERPPSGSDLEVGETPLWGGCYVKRAPYGNPRLVFRQPEVLVAGSRIQSLGLEDGETWSGPCCGPGFAALIKLFLLSLSLCGLNRADNIFQQSVRK